MLTPRIRHGGAALDPPQRTVGRRLGRGLYVYLKDATERIGDDAREFRAGEVEKLLIRDTPADREERHRRQKPPAAAKKPSHGELRLLSTS
jgi:hypothetical protein